MTIRTGLLIGAMVGLTVAGAGAQPRAGDAQAAKAITCAACHGPDGNSRSDTMPILAGMDPAYFTKQIQDYASGRRPSPEMEPYAKQTLDLGVDDVATFFARQRMAPTPIRADAGAVARGRQSAAACVSCHGAEGKGDRARVVPGLAGQPPGYLRAQMQLFKREQRQVPDPAKAVMKALADEAVADLAAYYSSLRP